MNYAWKIKKLQKYNLKNPPVEKKSHDEEKHQIPTQMP